MNELDNIFKKMAGEASKNPLDSNANRLWLEGLAERLGRMQDADWIDLNTAREAGASDSEVEALRFTIDTLQTIRAAQEPQELIARAGRNYLKIAFARRTLNRIGSQKPLADAITYLLNAASAYAPEQDVNAANSVVAVDDLRKFAAKHRAGGFGGII